MIFIIIINFCCWNQIYYNNRKIIIFINTLYVLLQTVHLNVSISWPNKTSLNIYSSYSMTFWRYHPMISLSQSIITPISAPRCSMFDVVCATTVDIENIGRRAGDNLISFVFGEHSVNTYLMCLIYNWFVIVAMPMREQSRDGRHSCRRNDGLRK